MNKTLYLAYIQFVNKKNITVICVTIQGTSIFLRIFGQQETNESLKNIFKTHFYKVYLLDTSNKRKF